MSIQLFHLSIMNLDMMKIVFVISFIIPMCYSFNGDAFRNCSLLYKCGSLQNLGYPFWGGDRPDYCGRQDFSLECVDGQYTDIWLDDMSYRVLGVDPSVPKMTIARNDIWNGICPDESSYYRNSTLSNFNLNSARTVRTLHIFYGCTSEVISTVQVKSNVTCSVNGVRSGVFFADEFVSGIEGCSMSLAVPIQLAAYNDLWDGKITLQKALNQGFDVEYNAALAACTSCEASGGKCGSNSNYEFICICQDQSYPMLCPKRGSHRNRKIVLLATGTSAAGIGVIVCLVICYSIIQFNKRSKQNLNLEAAIKQYGSITPKRYSYSDIKKMTNSFKDKLGKGGYGDVYKGNLFDNRPIAVKVLNTSKGSGEEFINEVASISRTSHVNVVTLLGFCLDGQKRALVYEFMPNGSLERYIHAETASVTAGHLGWKKLYQIALGIARGLEYLHRGCTMRIVHFDIKPHNILLDEDFCPKISDFGLSKLCTRKESVISMLEARGTIGYIAPEVFCRNFGCVSHKSDVYSYGMMLLEMVGGRKNIKIGVSHTSEIYFPHWVYQRVVLDEDLKLQGVMTPEEDEIARKMVLVGLWCIQTDPSQRPAMSKVIEMLEGSLQALEIPPKPVFGSPSTSPENSSAAIVVS